MIDFIIALAKVTEREVTPEEWRAEMAAEAAAGAAPGLAGTTPRDGAADPASQE